MAVSINLSGNMRSDFMISDAALPQRIEEIAEEQAGMFAQLLSDIGDTKSDLAVEVEKVVQKYSDMKEAGEQAVYRDKETGRVLPEDPRKLATLILKGKVKISNVPCELITPELMKLLMLMKKSTEFQKDDDEGDDEKDSLFNPVDAIAAEQKFQQELSNSMLMELYQIIEKHNECESEDKVTMLDGICEPIDETETLPSPLTVEHDMAVGEDVFTQMIDNLVETVSEEQDEAVKEAVVEKAAEGVIPDVDAFVPSETVEESKVAVDAADVVDVRVAADAPIASNAPAAVSAVTETEIPQATVEAKAAEQIVSETSQFNTAGEQAAAVQTAVSQNEQSAETTATIPVEEFTVKTEKIETKPEIAENAVKVNDSKEPVVVKAVTRNDNAEQLDKTVSEEPKTVSAGNERVKSAAEEFEMLRSAKARSAVKPVEENIEVKSEIRPEQTAQPLNADQPVVFKRADGSEIEVRPSEIIDQTARLVEKAIAENNEKTEYSLVLNPEELGKITVKLTKAADGAISVTVAAENARTQRILEQHSDTMQENLRSNGLNLESWQTVNERQQETAAQDYNGSSKNPYFRNDDNNTEEESDGKSFSDIIASM